MPLAYHNNEDTGRKTRSQTMDNPTLLDATTQLHTALKIISLNRRDRACYGLYKNRGWSTPPNPKVNSPGIVDRPFVTRQ